MRLVDADALLKTHNAESRLIGKDWTVDDLATAIEVAPTIDAIPVVHGRWLEASDGDGKVCGACGEDFCDIVLGCNVSEWKYCPVCGARMDGERRDGDEVGIIALMPQLAHVQGDQLFYLHAYKLCNLFADLGKKVNNRPIVE